ncbi:MAG: hypothetical protein PUB22_04050 [Clostridiales bacterium]|nr:hypothetical protein [Clostridiales bacterium]
MKIKLLVKLGELILGEVYPDEEPRADMYLPIWLLAFALLLLAGGAAVAVLAIVFLSVPAAIVALASLILGTTALLCWKNQKVLMLSDDSFEYTTFLGNKKVYRFSEIVDLKVGIDSMTLLMENGKVHIESSAIITERLVDRINKELSEKE